MWRFNTPRVWQALKSYEHVARDEGVSMATLALSWACSRPYVGGGAPIIGATSVAQLADNIESCSHVLSDDALKAIDQVHIEYRDPSQFI